MRAQTNQRTIYTDQIRTTWNSFSDEEQTWAMLKMPADLRATLHRITAVAGPKKSVTEMLQELKTPSSLPVKAYSMLDQIRGNPELKLLEFLNASQGETT